jgi:glutathione S-transferase
MLKLISFTLCPFVQRAVVVLREKDVAFDVEYISLQAKPEWFLKLSPRGKVPIVVVEDGRVLFESQAICEYLDETTPGVKLMPQDAFLRARDRAWFAFAGEDLFGPLWRIETAKDAATIDEVRVLIEKSLARVEEEMQGRRFLSGDGTRFGMADVAMAPALFRLDVLKREFGLDLVSRFANLTAWSAQVLARDSVVRSVPPSWNTDHREMMQKMGAHLKKVV